MLIAFENYMINPAHITMCELRSGDTPSEVELYILFTGEGELSLEGMQAVRLWEYLKTFLVGTEVPALHAAIKAAS